MLKGRNVIFCGDIHGKWRQLVWNLTERYKLKDISVVIAGDIGIGFDKSLKYDYQRFGSKLEKNNINIYCVRGNHDDPKYFRGEVEDFNFPRITLLKDYEPVHICGITILPIGGAISIDQDLRIKESRRRVTWWEDEDVVRLDIKKIPTNIDVVVSHESPMSFEPIFTDSIPGVRKEVLEKSLDTRRYLDQVLFNLGDHCRRWIFGHHHKSFSGNFGKILYRGLGELELF